MVARHNVYGGNLVMEQINLKIKKCLFGWISPILIWNKNSNLFFQISIFIMHSNSFMNKN